MSQLTKIIPLFDRVLVKRTKELEQKHGLYLPETARAKEKPQEGVVVSAGINAVHVRVGDTVLFGKYSGNEIEIDEQEYLILKEEEILAIIETEYVN